MKFLSYAYRFASNFLFLIMVYYTLNFLDKYNQRAVVAIMVLIYSAMRAASALRSFYFFQRIERLEVETRRLAAAAGEGHSAASQRKLVVNEVSALRQAGEMKAYIDLLFLALIVLVMRVEDRDELKRQRIKASHASLPDLNHSLDRPAVRCRRRVLS